jgi:Predicted nucleotide-binding protein containing TIR-like domain
MKKKSEVWLVDDLPSNLKKFKSNHKNHYKIRTFSHPNKVMERIAKGKRPDALLCDVFFYDTVKKAKRAEEVVDDLSKDLKRAATKANANDHSLTLGIDLIEKIYEHFDRKRLPFPMYAYTSKGPFLLEGKEWKKLSQFGAEILLKNRVSPAYERHEIDGDIFLRKRNPKRVFIGHGKSPAWKRLKTFLVKKFKLKYEEFNRISAAGKTTQQKLTSMLSECGFAFLVFTAEDSHKDETRHARENVIHELGLFQSRLGWDKAIILLEEGCQQFSNILGHTQIRFPKGKIEKGFKEVERVLKREGIIP